MKTVDVIVAVLLIIGGLNFGIVGLFGFNVLAVVFGHLPLLERVIYVLIGLSALYKIYLFKGIKCSGGGG